MTRVLLIGYDPPGFNKSLKTEAANYRTWQFLEPLIQDGHTVCLCTDRQVENGIPVNIPNHWQSQIHDHPIPFGRLGWISELQRVHDRFDPECILAVNFYPCLYATRLRTFKPIWMDIYGDMVTIIQASGYRRSSNRGLPTTISFLKKILTKGDIFSVCGTPQQHMLVGELAMTGRLNYRTFGYLFVHVILPGAAPIPLSPNRRKQRPLLSPLGIDKHDFVLLWAGGYNTWTDVETLFNGLQYAMSQDAKIHFVSLGANTYRATDNVYHRFLDLLVASPHQDRFHMLGWRPWEEVPLFYSECDAGLNIDAMHYETVYGTRTRILEMIAAGLPVITSLGSEISHLLQNQGIAFGFETGDWRKLGEQVLSLSRDTDRRATLSRLAISLAQREWSFSDTTQAIRNWVLSPHEAPDRQNASFQRQLKEIQHLGRARLRQLIWRLTGADK